MEVHHHSHTADPDSHRGRKKWTHYFWEFFMLFLAVTLGFFVENQREHLVEHQREKQYMRSMVEDLKSDTAALSRIIRLRTNRIKIHDSLSFLLTEPVDMAFLSDLYYLSALCRRTALLRFINNDRTIQQLKNSGGLRLIRKQNVSDSIALYDSYVKRLEQIEERERESIRDMISYTYKIFDGRIYYTMLDETDRVYRPPGNPALLKYTKEDMNAFISALFSVKSINIAYRNFSRGAYYKAANLLKTIEEEYHLK